MRSRRAWIYVLSVVALLGPAAGIAYLGAVSYRDERGALTAQQERQTQAALRIAGRINHAIERALDAVERTTAVAATQSSIDDPLARHWFWIENDKLRVPRPAAGSLALSGESDRGADCSNLGPEACIREGQTRQTRVAQLHVAQRAEANQSWADARRFYNDLQKFDDTGPAALLGLARVLGRLGDRPRANEALAELERRFADRTIEVVPVRLAVATLRAEAGGTDALLAVAERVLAGGFAIDPIVRIGVIARLRARTDPAGAPEEPRARTARTDPAGGPAEPRARTDHPAAGAGGGLTAEQARRRAAIDDQVGAIRSEARAAAGLADDVPEIARTAAAGWRGRASSHDPARTVIYRRHARAAGTIGIAVDAPMLEQAAGARPEDEVAQHARALVLPSGGSPEPGLRTITQVPFGSALPHLSLALVNPIADPDPTDEVIRSRSRRHILYTSALAVALGLGLLATIRGAVRARELAQLKSDFVSTVSHELKTPLTSIRMFAEMLEQGVAQGDPAKMARYHGVIVQESQRLGLLIANLLDYAQIEKGTRRYAPSRHGIAQLARHAVATFETLRDPELSTPPGGAARDRDRNALAITVSPEAMAADVEVDRDVVVQALLNLLANAVKYGGADEPIEVAVGADAALAWIAVRDHGPGIPAPEQSRIFREFYRAPEAYRSNVEGTGLGLALVKRHIEALGGEVAVASNVGDGATFTIRFARIVARASSSALELP